MVGTVGVVLAGGRSRRMGADKGQLLIGETPMLVHMANILIKAGVDEVVLSGTTAAGFASIADKTPYAGPAQGMLTVAHPSLHHAERFLFVPVDMPLLNGGRLQQLLAQQKSCYFGDCFLPCVLYHKNMSAVDPETAAVKHLLAQAGAVALTKPDGNPQQFLNINTPEAFADAVKIL